MKPVIGIEIHVELKTNSKMFCSCDGHHFGVEPNTHTCPVCFGLPGALPVPNKQAIEWAIMIGKALNCQINSHSKFDRKHYFYPDLPKGYQISQYDQPLCVNGYLETSSGKVGITRVHMEEDTAKLQHIGGDTLVDFNRSGVPLVEIVSEPDITTAKQAKEYAQNIRNIVQFLKVSDGDLEKGSMRLEANISWGMDLGYKVEVKNINSYRFLEQAIDYELVRQKQALDSGTTPIQETRGWSEAKNATFPQRSKEDAKDYRYFPEPDIPPMEFTEKEIEDISVKIPLLPQNYFDTFTKEFNLKPDSAKILIEHRKLAEKTLACLTLSRKVDLSTTTVANYLINKKAITADKTPEEIISLISKDTQKPTIADDQISAFIDAAITENPDVVEKYKSGKTAVIGVLVGSVMKLSKGTANPAQVNKLLTDRLK